MTPVQLFFDYLCHMKWSIHSYSYSVTFIWSNQKWPAQENDAHDCYRFFIATADENRNPF